MRSLLFASSLLVAPAAFAAPGYVPVQGYLTDEAGTPIDGSVSIRFRLYADSTTTTTFYNDLLTVDAQNGRFSARLGAGTVPLELDDFATNTAAYLTIKIENDPESERIALDTVPYAAYAGDAGTLQGSTLNDVLDQIPNQTEIDASIRAIAYDTEAELTALLDDNYGGSSAVNWADIQNRPNGLDDGDDTASQTQVEGWAAGVCFDTEAELTTLLDDNYRPASYVPAWGQITGIPADIADGDQGATYTAGNGLALTSGAFSVSEYAGGPLIPNARFESTNTTGWTIEAGGAGTVVADTLNAAGGYAFRNTAGSVAWISNNARVPVRFAQTYQVSGKFRRVDTVATSAGTIYLAVRFFDASGANIGGDGTWNYYPVSGDQITDNIWHTYSFEFGENARPIPANARTMTVGAILNYNGGAGNRIYEVTDLQLNTVEGRGNYWRTGGLALGWVNYGGEYNPFAYTKDSAGVVHLRGLVRNGSAGTVFNLPPGYRPAYRELFASYTSGGAGRIDVRANGDIEFVNVATGWTSFDGISFVAAQ